MASTRTLSCVARACTVGEPGKVYPSLKPMLEPSHLLSVIPRRAASLTCTGVLCLAVVAHAADPRGADKAIVAIRTATPPNRDGKLDDPAWGAAPVDDSFIQLAPLEDQAPTERTEIRIVYDDEAIYVAFRAYDSSPSEIVRRLTRR